MEINYKEEYKKFFTQFSIGDNRIYALKIKEIATLNQTYLNFSFNHLFEFNKDLAVYLIEKPEEQFEYINETLKELVSEIDQNFANKVHTIYGRITEIFPEYTVPIRKIRAQHVGTLIQVKGIVTKCSKIKQKMIEAEFECRSCRNLFKINFKETGIRKIEQVRCKYCESEIPPKLLNRKMIDFQRIILQEPTEELPPGQIPRNIEIYLEDDLVDKAYPGNHVTIIGILKEKREKDYFEEPAFGTYVYAINLEVKEKLFEEEEISKEEEEEILKLASMPDITQRIVKSIAPSIFGLENIKLALALQLFGGVPKILPDGVKVRGDINILLIGDPGTAKTQLLRYMAQLAPKAVYTSGKGVSAAGLTATVVRDKTSGEFYLEAGALVLGDQGLVCVDEIDKIRAEDRVAMHEAMEQQTISIAKAGIVATLNARCSLLAAANPTLGRFDKTKTIVDNIDLPVTLLSRFDLIFPIIDVPDKNYDASLAQHMLNLYSEKSEKIKEEIIPPQLLKKYIIYARKNIKPKLTEEAIKEISNFYLKMREISYKEESAPTAITPRQLDALVRLTEAKARMSLRNECNAEDALTAINLMKSMMMETFIDIQTHQIDVDIIMTGKPKSQREKENKILNILTEMNYQSEMVEKDIILNKAESSGIAREEAEKILNRLIKEGFIYEPRTGYIKRTP